MTKPLRKFVRGVKKQARKRRKESRTHSLQDAAQRLLARWDYDKVSIALIAKEAGCSVGALYSRYKDKDRFLTHVIALTFRSASGMAERDLPSSPRSGSLERAVREVVGHVASQLASRRTAGVLRAAAKLQATIPVAGKPVADYRELVTDRAIGLLKPHLDYRGAEKAIHIAMQIVFATVIDATINNPRPLRSGSAQLVNSLSDVVTAYLDRDNSDLELEENDEEFAADDAAEVHSRRAAGSDDEEIDVIDADIGDVTGKVRFSKKGARRTKTSKSTTKPAEPSQKSRGPNKPSGKGAQLAANKAKKPRVPASPPKDGRKAKPRRRLI